MKYKLINSVTKKETICDKITIDGFDYYVNDEIIKDVRPYKGKWQIEGGYTLNKFPTYLTDLSECRIVIATTNPNIDIPKVVDEVKELFNSWYDKSGKITPSKIEKRSFIEGYNKSQETHSNSDEDMIEFAEWCSQNSYKLCANGEWILLGTGEYKSVAKSTKELLEIWKEQRLKTIYYE